MSEIWAEGSGDRGTPALHFSLDGRPGQEGWLVAGDPHQGHFDFGPVEFSLHAAGTPEETADLTRTSRDRNLLAFVMGPDGVLRYAVSTRRGSPSSGRVREGDAVATPWMGLQVKVDRILRRAVRERRVARLPLPRREEDRSPAVRVRLRGPRDSESLWLGWSESGAVPWEGGEAQVAYGATSTRLPFRVTLLDFRSEKYPGSSMPATYESRVRVDDPEQGSSEHLISMNHPLHVRGYTFFQASFIEGEPMTSILSVSRSPGLPLVYLGTALISLGILWMTALKSLLARRQARAALAGRHAGPGTTGHPAAAGA
jgi:ResB-like family protein